ncbi:MAG: 30S ribosomal protein S17 [Bacilli bacterium]|nr:30S ribosomal protein S17 [Bacilli bacterium]
MERNSRSTFQGVVINTKNEKTICVLVSTKKNSPIYAKRVGYSKKFYAHDENNEAKKGDIVTIAACRPLSKTKRFRLVSIDKKADSLIEVVEKLEAEEAVEEKKEEEVK